VLPVPQHAVRLRLIAADPQHVQDYCLATSQPVCAPDLRSELELFQTEHPLGCHAALLPVTNVPPHVCHARGSRVSCQLGLAELVSFNLPSAPGLSDCYHPGTRSYRALSFRTLAGVFVLLGLTIIQRSPIKGHRSPSYNRIHTTSASIPAANRLYQGRTDVADFPARGPFPFPRQDQDPSDESPEIPLWEPRSFGGHPGNRFERDSNPPPFGRCTACRRQVVI
jgi:hypothetical protein